MQVRISLIGEPENPTSMLELVLSERNLADLVSDPTHRGFISKSPRPGLIVMVSTEADATHYPAAHIDPLVVSVPGGIG